MSTTLPHGIIQINEGNISWYGDITANWQLIDSKIGIYDAAVASIPAPANNGTLTINYGSATLAMFGADDAGNVTADIPAPGDGTLTVTQGGSTLGSFNANQATPKTIDIPAPGDGTLTIQLNGVDVQTFTANQSGNATANIVTPAINNGTLTIRLNGVDVQTFTANQANDVVADIIPPVPGDGTLTIKVNGSTAGTFTANQSTAATANITVPTAVSELTNDSGYLTSSSNLDASKLTSGTVDIARLPQGALERLVKVANEAARYALTTADVQLGDTVQQLDTGIMYVVTDTDHLDSAAGYTEYTAGAAASVPWSGVTGKPTFAAVATSGAYSDLTGTPTIPTVNDATLTIQQNGTTVDMFTANSSSDKTVNIQCVDLTSNQTVGGDKEFTGTTTAHDVIPSATDTYNFGSPSYQWNNAYIKSLTINGVACGDILTHNASEFVDVSSDQTIGGVKTFSNLRTYFGRDISCYSRSKYGKNLNPTSTSYQYLSFGGNTVSDGSTNDWSSGYLEQVVNTNGSSRSRWFTQDTSENAVGLELWASGNDKQVRPFRNNAYDLGTSTNKWKSVYSNTYYLGDTAFGDIVTHNASEFAPVSDLATVATSGSYNDLSNKPTIPTVNNATLTIQKNGTTVKTFTANASSNVTANITVPTKTSDLTNDSGFLTSADLLPIGSYIQFAGSQAPAGFLVCNGGAISRTTYSALFAVIGTTYGSGDGSTTFNLPDLTDRFLQGSSTSGTVINAGLPNITGGVRFHGSGVGTNLATVNGSFVGVGEKSLYYGGTPQGGANSYDGFDFNASNSNSIYGNSDTVQPPALTCLICIKY